MKHPIRQSSFYFRNGRWWFVRGKDGARLAVGPLLARARWMVGPLCRLLGTSRRTFQRVVTESLGITPKEWLRRERIVAATRLLREAVAVKRVASELGFRHARDFTEEFRLWMGLCPGAWRLSHAERGREASARLVGRCGR